MTEERLETAPVSWSARIQLAHAAVQRVAELNGIDLLHIKGYSLDPVLRVDRTSTDVDVLVRPQQVSDAIRAFQEVGWQYRIGFEAGSSFEHSMTLWHPIWGYLDVHRVFPGIPQDSFSALWDARVGAPIGGLTCPTPDLIDQRITLILHAARSFGSGRADADLRTAWFQASSDEQQVIERRVDQLGARLGFDAAFGRLDAHRHEREYLLWKVASQGGTRAAEWRARVRAARGPLAKLWLIARAPLVNVEHLTNLRGRPPGIREIVREFFARPVRAIRQEWQHWRSHA